jgi:chitinase
MKRSWLLFACACGGAAVTIKTQQDFDNVAVDAMKQLIDITKTDGINCDLLATDIKAFAHSQRVKALIEYRKAHADDVKKDQDLGAKIGPLLPELKTAAAPGEHACGPVFEDGLAPISSGEQPTAEPNE